MAARTDSPVGGIVGIDNVGPSQTLPNPLSSFIGREHEIGEVETLLDEARLVTLTGTGGSGKTRLAIEAAKRAATGLGVESAFVDLAPISDPALIAATIATALAIRPAPRHTVAEAIIEWARARPLLLVLDNLEQLLPHGGATVAELLAVAPDLRVLATSRASLRVRGERAYRVDPLVETEAVELFIERAHAVDAHFAVTDETRSAVENICRRLDGLPLAIELAAAHSKLLTAEALLRRLEQGVPLPETAPIDAPARQRTLRDTIAWSFDLLDRPARVVLTRASGFVGGFSAPAAEVAIPDPADDPPIDVIAAIDRLVDHNLVQVAPDARGEPRFSMLEAIREFSLRQLLPDELDRFRARHAGYFVDATSRSASEYGAIPTLDSEIDLDDVGNLRAGLDWAEHNGPPESLVKLGTAAWGFFGRLGHRDEAGHWLDVAYRSSASAPPAIRAASLYYMARHEMVYGGSRLRAEAFAMEALQVVEQSGDHVRAIRILMLLCQAAADRGDRWGALDQLSRAVGLARGLDDRRLRARFLAEIAASGHGVLDLAETKALADEALRDGRALGDATAVILGLEVLGRVYLAEGDASGGVRVLAESKAIHERHGLDQAELLPSIGVALLRAGDVAASRSEILDALTHARHLEIPYLGLISLESAAEWLGACGLPAEAVACWSAFDAVRRRTLNRTPGDDMGLFLSPRDRDRSALSSSAYDVAVTKGMAMTLEEAIASADEWMRRAGTQAAKHAPGLLRRGLDLTTRELEVLQLLAAGRSDGQIAEVLFISKKTAAVHVANIKGKFGASSRVEIVTIALHAGLVEVEP
jgi:predicted ATPase/DNA-binding CsgD family transcriptional regulator